MSALIFYKLDTASLFFEAKSKFLQVTKCYSSHLHNYLWAVNKLLRLGCLGQGELQMLGSLFYASLQQQFSCIYIFSPLCRLHKGAMYIFKMLEQLMHGLMYHIKPMHNTLNPFFGWINEYLNVNLLNSLNPWMLHNLMIINPPCSV